LGAELRFLLRVPADRRRIEEHARALEGGEPGGLGIPLIPADQGSDAAGPRVDRLEPEVAGSEVELLVVGRVVRDVHLAVQAGGPCARWARRWAGSWPGRAACACGRAPFLRGGRKKGRGRGEGGWGKGPIPPARETTSRWRARERAR